MYLIAMVVICFKQHLSNIWSSIHEKVKKQWGWVEKSVAYKKKRLEATVNYFRKKFHIGHLTEFGIIYLCFSAIIADQISFYGGVFPKNC